MAAAPRYTEAQRKEKMEDFLKVYENSHGLIHKSCNEVNVKYDTIAKWRERYPDFDEAIKAIDERVGDMVIGQLMRKILDGDKASIMFWLKCRKHWKETSKVEVTSGNDYDVEGAIADLQKTLKKK